MKRQTLLSKMCVAEAVGTFALVFLGCGSLMVADRFPGGVPPGAVPVVFGAAVAAMIYAVGHISGAHFNPAVTLGFAVGQRIHWRVVLPYWFAQISGALLALCLLHGCLPKGVSYGAAIPAVFHWQGFLIEMVLTFFLMFVIISVATDSRAHQGMAGIAIGLTVMMCAFVGGPLTGASMNPARSLAPAIFQGVWDGFWIYLLGPTVGASAAAWLYDWMRGKST